MELRLSLGYNMFLVFVPIRSSCCCVTLLDSCAATYKKSSDLIWLRHLEGTVAILDKRIQFVAIAIKNSNEFE